MRIYWDVFMMALSALKANKLRSGLTLLGVIIGVTSVITIISALEGLSQSIEAEINKMGPTTFMVTRMGMIFSEEEFFEAIRRRPMKIEYMEAIEEGCEYCEKVAARTYTMVNVKYQNKKISRLFGIAATANFIDIVEYEVGQGRFFSQEEDHNRRRVAFIGTAIQDELFPNVDPIGKDIKINNIRYEVIGIAKKQGASFGHNQDLVVFIPLSTYAKDFGTSRRRLRNLAILVKAQSLELLDQAMDQTRVILRAYRHVPYDKDDDFSMLTADTIMDALNRVTKFLRLGLIGVTSISLIVGGIIIMNIMMVSVTERTREIGIRKSIGARRRDILLQFLYEALVLSLGGGLIGIAFGVFLGDVLIGLINMDMTPSLYAIAIGLGISTGVGLFFGIYPAMKASRMQPVKALSYE
ncbi:MAG: ABC transporter permease [Candidatus Zixiibacteriota bacterium]|nr:MAG: ABC transporter permease [candidate division Zixibacteria bacterium]